MSGLSSWMPLLAGHRAARGMWEHLVMAGLRPWGGLMAGVTRGRAWAYGHHLLPVYPPPCPVISIGNLVAGGTGKTPLTLWLARRLREMGWRPAIVSRGYGQASQQPLTVVSDGRGERLPAHLASDEALLMAERLPDIPVLCAPQRRLAIHHAVTACGCDLVILDDGFQHLAVSRTLDILLLDGQHPWANGRVLPAGLLREPLASLARAHVILLTRAPTPDLTRMVTRQLSQWGLSIPVLSSEHRFSHWRRLDQDLPATTPPSPVLAFSGIGRPDSFHQLVRTTGLKLAGFRIFADHHPFSQQDLRDLSAHARILGAAALVCTAKDAVKLAALTPTMPTFVLEMDLFFPEGITPLMTELQRRLPPMPTF